MDPKLFPKYRVICTPEGIFRVEEHIDGAPWIGDKNWKVIKECGTGQDRFIEATKYRNIMLTKR